MSTVRIAAGTDTTVEQVRREDELVSRVVESFANSQDSRLRLLMQALTRHLHAFIREVRLTEDELSAAIKFLTDAGHVTDDERQELILLADVLGASMQTVPVNNQVFGDATEATVLGPFYNEHAPEIELGGDVAGVASGCFARVEGTVTDVQGRPFPTLASRSGKRTTRATTTCGPETAGCPGERTCTPTVLAGIASGP